MLTNTWIVSQFVVIMNKIAIKSLKKIFRNTYNPGCPGTSSEGKAGLELPASVFPMLFNLVGLNV